MPAPAVLVTAFAAGSIPFSGLAARLLAGVDLRRVGAGTVSGTGLYHATGFGPLALAGSLDVAKGAVGPALAGPGRPALGAAAAACAVTGHNWSPLLRGAGGRGISPALGALAVLAPEGAALLIGALTAGRLLRQTGLATLGALVGLGPLLAYRRGRSGALCALGVAGPMVLKRLTGNRPAPGLAGRWAPAPRRARILVSRLLFDRDPA